MGSGEGVNERPVRAVVAQHLIRIAAADIQVSIGTEDQPIRSTEAPTLRGDKVVNERSRCAVVAQHFIRIAITDVQVIIGAKDQA